MSQRLPQPDSDGCTRTFNKMGIMISKLDPYSQSYVEFSTKAKLPVLEIGCAFGIAVIEALKSGAKVIANDLDPRHLEVVYQAAPPELRNNLSLLPGAFPNITLASESVEAILISRVLHFFSGEEFMVALQAVFRLLAPGGKLFLVVDSPFLGRLEPFLPQYLERKAKGIAWPGLITDVSAAAGKRAENLPQMFHSFDTETVAESIVQVGFEIDQIGYINQIFYPTDLRNDGRESVGCIAVKPKK